MADDEGPAEHDPVIRAIYYPGTGTGYWFGDGDSYSPYGMICKVSERRGMTSDNAPWDQQGNIGAGVMSGTKTAGNAIVDPRSPSGLY